MVGGYTVRNISHPIFYYHLCSSFLIFLIKLLSSHPCHCKYFGPPQALQEKNPVHFYKHLSFSWFFICSIKLICSYPVHCGYLILSPLLGESCNKIAVAAFVWIGAFIWNGGNNYVLGKVYSKIKQACFLFVAHCLLEGWDVFFAFIVYQFK